MVIKTFQIFKAGKHTASNGVKLTIGERDIEAMATSYSEGIRRAPLTLGHPENDSPDLGSVKGLFARGGALYAVGSVGDRLLSLVRGGSYRKVSAAFFTPAGKGNPRPGAFYLKHVGFLGAQPPAVKGMAGLAFCEATDFDPGAGGDSCALFAERSPVAVASGCGRNHPREPLHRAALDMARTVQGLPYPEAVRRLIAAGMSD